MKCKIMLPISGLLVALLCSSGQAQTYKVNLKRGADSTEWREGKEGALVGEFRSIYDFTIVEAIEGLSYKAQGLDGNWGPVTPTGQNIGANGSPISLIMFHQQTPWPDKFLIARAFTAKGWDSFIIVGEGGQIGLHQSVIFALQLFWIEKPRNLDSASAALLVQATLNAAVTAMSDPKEALEHITEKDVISEALKIIGPVNKDNGGGGGGGGGLSPLALAIAGGVASSIGTDVINQARQNMKPAIDELFRRMNQIQRPTVNYPRPPIPAPPIPTPNPPKPPKPNPK